MRAITIHGHFYQPPRESPWTGAIPFQPDAAPHANWNDRVHAECYAPNAAARVHGPEGATETLATYSRMSFDFGPTLLEWLERAHSSTYRAILDADLESRERFGGHGTAIAHPYAHTILPLDSPRDRRTQILWGARDFAHRFGRAAEGMWLPETAVDTATLEALADCGIRFTILAPHQARRSRAPGATSFGTTVDTSRPHAQRLPSGKRIHLFFYDGARSHEIAFGNALGNGQALAEHLQADANRTGGLAHVAVDGETFGHHKKFGELGLAHALRVLDASPRAPLTCYGQVLARGEEPGEVEIAEQTSWSCAHGVERWRRDCGCSSGSHPDATQAWRAPLREALDGLRDETATAYEHAAGALVRDPWAARDDFIEVLLDPSGTREFVARHALRELSGAETARLLSLLELSRQTLLMYTSCAFFFDDPMDHGTIQTLRHARRAVELTLDILEHDVEPSLASRLSLAKSSDPRHPNALDIYRTLAGPESERALREVGT